MIQRIRVLKSAQHIPQSAIGGAGEFSDFIGGAFGYVREHHIKQAAVKVELRNGIMLHTVAVPSRGWVAPTTGDKSTGGVDLPPIGSYVFVLFPYGIGNPTGALVLFSVFDDQNKKHQAFLKEGDEAKVVEVVEGGLRITYDREAKSFLVEDVDDEKLKVQLDKANKKLLVTDWNDNKATLDSNGMILEAKSHKVTFSSDSLKLEAKGNTVTLEAGKTTINGNLEVAQ